MKLKKLLTLALLMTGVSTWAQTDVTSTYITNADFSTTDGWTLSASSQYHDQGSGLIGTYAVANNKTSTTDETHLATEYCFGFQCRWSTNFTSYQQTKSDAELPAGFYSITYDVQNTNACTSATYNNLFYVKVGETTYSDTSTEWMSGSTGWTTHTISFTLNDATTADFMISLGYGTGSNNYASTATPHLYVSHLKMTFTSITRPTAIALNETSLALNPTQSSTLSVTYTPADANTDTDITWTSSDATVATVDGGVVTAVGAGSATITATTANSVSTTCAVTVTDVTPVAAPASYSEVAAGDFYIVNAATGKYLGGANSWGTQASLIEHGIPFTVAIGEGVYTLDSHTYNNEASHFFNGTFVDGASTNLYITSLGSGKYSISTADGSAFVTANVNDNVVANTAPTANSVLAQWYFVSKADREALLASATDAAPVDATYYLTEANISRNLRKAYNTSGWTGTFSYGGANENQCAERYCATTDVYQTLTVPNGKYTVSCQGFYRRQSAEATSYLYANNEPVALNRIEFGGINSMTGASEAFTNGEYNNSLTVYVTDGTLKVGIKCDAATNWTIWDNFELYYYGPIIGGEAEELPETAMTAGKWYYFDIAVDGDYDLTLTTLADIVYTTDGTILIENEDGVTDNFLGISEIALTAGRYYVKSASAQTLAVAAHSFTYEVGDPTPSVADNGYSQSTTITLTYSDAATNDPNGEFQILDASKITVDGEAAEASISGKVLTITLTDAVTVGASYAVSVAAGAVGYNTDDAANYNTATSLTINTPIVLDGEYCLYDATNKLFLGRGNSWGTEASVDKYGIPFNLVTDATNVSSIEFVDWTGVYLFLTGTSIFTDNASTGWKMVATEGGYYLKTADGAYYAAHASGTYGEYVYATSEEASATVWTLKTKAERDAIIAAYPTDNISNVISASGISTTAGAFETYLTTNYNAIDCTSAIGTATFAGAAGSWTWNETARKEDGQPAYGTGFVEAWNATGAWTQTIDKANLPAGIYKVTVQGYERRKANDAATALKTAGYNLVSTFLSANGEQVRFTDWNDVDGKPTNTSGAVTAFTNGEAVNEVYVYLDGNTDLNLMIRKPNYIWDCWVIMNNFTLTRYEQASATMVISDAQYATFVAPFAVEIPADVTAYTVDGVTGSTLNMTEVETTIPANTPVVLFKESALAETTFYGKTVDGTPTEGLLTGTYTDIDAPNGSYILQNQSGVVGFYQVDTNAATPKVRANRAYLTIANGGEVKAFYLGGGEDAIKSVFEGVAAGEVYDLSGRKVSKLQRGVNIVNGKKVIVK